MLKENWTTTYLLVFWRNVLSFSVSYYIFVSNSLLLKGKFISVCDVYYITTLLYLCFYIYIFIFIIVCLYVLCLTLPVIQRNLRMVEINKYYYYYYYYYYYLNPRIKLNHNKYIVQFVSTPWLISLQYYQATAHQAVMMLLTLELYIATSLLNRNFSW